MLLTMTEVIGRRLFNSPVPGAIDYIETGMVTFAFVGAAYCQRSGKPIWAKWVADNKAKGLPAQEALDLVLKTAKAAQ